MTDAQWFTVNIALANPCPDSSFPPSSGTLVDTFPFDLFQSSIPISYVPNPPLISLPTTSSTSIPTSFAIPTVSYVPSSSSLPSSSLHTISSRTTSGTSDSVILVNTHPMLTRSKLGIHKPKVFKVVTDYTYQEAPSFVVASRHPQWIVAIDSEFHSLLK